MPSPVVQDYLKEIWTAAEWSTSPMTTSALAARLGLSPSTVSEQVARLAERGLVHHAPYRPIELTAEGAAEAVKVVRRHRLLETYLVAELDYTWDEVHTEAEVLEHVVSDLLVDRLDARLGHPRYDPHGDPIPTREGRVERLRARPLADHRAGERGVVVRVGDRSSDVLRWCDEVGLRPGVLVEVTAAGVRVHGVTEPGPPRAATDVLVPAAAAAAILLAPEPPG